jgi:hypothetical protein
MSDTSSSDYALIVMMGERSAAGSFDLTQKSEHANDGPQQRGAPTPEQKAGDVMADELPDLTKLDDVDFVAERRKAREAVERSPLDFELIRRFAVIDMEFMRRAGMAWSDARP